jgi:chaperone protein EcpD
MGFRTKSPAPIIALALWMSAACAQASVVITGTRVIYPEAEREVTVKLDNDGNTPALVQAWLDDGDPKTLPSESKAPFTVMPPLFRLDPKKGQSLRLIYTHDPLPNDRESVFWLNVLEVPPRDASVGTDGSINKLHLAFRTRIKVFFRPPSLPGSPEDAAAQLHWRFVSGKDGGYVLEASNPTPYHVSFSRIVAKAGGMSWTSEKGGMVDPRGTATFDVGHVQAMPPAPVVVEYTFINDFGADVKGGG